MSKKIEQAISLLNEAKAELNTSTGNQNTGNQNTGNQNTGDWNTGHRNTGYCNTGHRNTGYGNTGNQNTGDRNTGDWNNGHRNTGDWNNGHRNTGFFNTTMPEKIMVFNRSCLLKTWQNAGKPACLYFDLTQWVYESAMSDVEKQENPSFSHAGGYLKKLDYKTEFTRSVMEASKEERDLIRALPNFDADIFLEISGVDLRLLDN